MDIVDDHDQVVGQMTREEIYRSGTKNYRVVNVFIMNNRGELLVPKRTMDRRIFPGCFDFSCGEHVHAKETYEEAARRGLSEELNLNNVEIEVLGKLTPADGVSSFQMNYLVRYDGPIKHNPAEVDSLHDMDVDTLIKMMDQEPARFKSDMPISVRKFRSLFV
jgi:isopentenyldiphosphate isomerase